MHMSENLGLPDQFHFPLPLPPEPPTSGISCKRKSPSRLRRQDCRQQEKSEDITVVNPVENVEKDKKQSKKLHPTVYKCTHCEHGYTVTEALLLHKKSIHPKCSPQILTDTALGVSFHHPCVSASH